MRCRVLNLDSSITSQPALLEAAAADVHDFARWGKRLRLACGWPAFWRFEQDLTQKAGLFDTRPWTTFIGSGDFHHVSLALLRRIREPFNLLVLDKHPDWMRGVPLLHCGTWLYHAAQLPQVRRIFHVGGETDFDNAFRWLMPTALLRTNKIVVNPAIRTFTGRPWNTIEQQTVRGDPEIPATSLRLQSLTWPHLDELGRWPLYISLDKDVLVASEAVVNWDSGHLHMSEVREIIRLFCHAAHQRLAGFDIVGDWSPVAVQGLLRRVLHLTEHPPLRVDPVSAGARNQDVNLALLDLAREMDWQKRRRVA